MPEIKYVEANGLRFAYLEQGTGPLVLLVHGFPDTAHTWSHVQPLIAAKGYRTVAIWTRGYAPSAIPKQDADLETLGRDILELIPALGETTAIIIGHDWGAGASYAAASLGPERIAKMIVVGVPHTASYVPLPWRLWGIRHFVMYQWRGAAKRFAKDDFAALPKIYKRWNPTWTPPAEEFAAVREAFSNPESLDAAFGYYRKIQFRPQEFLRKRIEVPTVVVSGTDDPNLTRKDYERARKMFAKDYVVEEMPGGHFMHREHPEAFAKLLLPHL